MQQSRIWVSLMYRNYLAYWGNSENTWMNVKYMFYFLVCEREKNPSLKVDFLYSLTYLYVFDLITKQNA